MRNLSLTQKGIIYVGVACFVLMCLIVPWRTAYYHNGRHTAPIGYGAIFAPPEQADEIDVPRMVVPMTVVLVATATGVLVTRQKVG